MRRRFFNIKKPLNNFINYTSSDNQIVTPSSTDFGSVLLKNTMIDGVGTLLFKSNVTKFGYNVFVRCTSLTSVTIGNSVTTIGESAFYDCTSLKSVTIPNSVTTIGKMAFWDCDSLTSVTIPNSITTIGERAFRFCTSLKTVYCKPTTPPAGGYRMFDNNASDRKIYVPYQSLDAYKTATYWSEYADDIVGYDFENDVVVG